VTLVVPPNEGEEKKEPVLLWSKLTNGGFPDGNEIASRIKAFQSEGTTPDLAQDKSSGCIVS